MTVPSSMTPHADEPRPTGPVYDEHLAIRRSQVAATLVRLGFLDTDHATPTNQAVEVLAGLLPPEAEVRLCLTCRKFTCSGQYEFAYAAGTFWDVATQALGAGGAHALREGPRPELVVCTRHHLCWTQSRANGVRSDAVALYSVAFSDILGATVRNRRKGVVDVYIDDGPTLSFRVRHQWAAELQALLDRAARSE